MDEKPITDKENFPHNGGQSDEKPPVIVIDASSQLAYFDGCADGYRKAVTDFLCFFLGFMAISLIVRSIGDA
jgi:hypothetical protein